MGFFYLFYCNNSTCQMVLAHYKVQNILLVMIMTINISVMSVTDINSFVFVAELQQSR